MVVKTVDKVFMNFKPHHKLHLREKELKDYRLVGVVDFDLNT